MLPEKLADEFDGTMESLYDIVENQLKMSLPSFKDDDEDDEDEDDDYDGRKNLISDEDDEDDEDVDEEPDEEEERPKKSKTTLKRGNKSSIKSVFKKKH